MKKYPIEGLSWPETPFKPIVPGSPTGPGKPLWPIYKYGNI